MKPNPLSSLNHFTVPVGICGTPPRYLSAVARRVLLRASPASACTTFRRLGGRPDSHETSRSDGGGVVEMFRLAVRLDRLAPLRERRFEGARIGLPVNERRSRRRGSAARSSGPAGHAAAAAARGGHPSGGVR